MKALILACLLFSSSAVAAELYEWDTAPDGTMVLTYHEVTKDGIQMRSYKHKIIRRGYPVPECNEVRKRGGRIWLMTREAKPKLYIVNGISIEMLEDVYVVQKPYFDWVK
jgi:hypothetical protein